MDRHLSEAKENWLKNAQLKIFNGKNILEKNANLREMLIVGKNASLVMVLKLELYRIT